MKQSIVQTISCPACKRGEAVNKEQVFGVFHSKPYAKKRRALKKAPPQPAPQVGQAMTVEHLLTSPKLPEAFAPPNRAWIKNEEVEEKDEDKFIRNMIYLAGLVVGLVAVYFELERATFKFILLVVVLGLFLIWMKASNVRLARQLQNIALQRDTWICLRCGHEWINTSSNQKQ